MRVEIRKSGGETCPQCGSYELVKTADGPVAADLHGVFEREILRREIGLARVLKDHLAAATAELNGREQEMTARLDKTLADERWQLRQDHHALIGDLERILTDTQVANDQARADIPKWRVMRRRREGIFAARLNETVDELLDRTKHSLA